MSPARRARPRSLLIRDLQALVTMDRRGRVLRGGYLYAEDGVIRAVGRRAPAGLAAERTIRAPFAVALPGPVNPHHHFCQTPTRAHPGAPRGGGRGARRRGRVFCPLSLRRRPPRRSPRSARPPATGRSGERRGAGCRWRDTSRTVYRVREGTA